LLEPLGKRWRHTLGVVERARAVGEVLTPDEAELLVAAAYLHDVGYAPELRETGFHPLDGARFIRSSGRERLAGLVAFHCSAVAEAEERGLLGELAEFVDERSVLSRGLTYCDLTTGPEGHRIEPAARVAEIRKRYGADSAEARALERSAAALLDDVRVIESMVSANNTATEAGGRRQMR
jgi:HD superfamily phosphodiesterase